METFLCIFLGFILCGMIVCPLCYAVGVSIGEDNVWKNAIEKHKARHNPDTGEKEWL